MLNLIIINKIQTKMKLYFLPLRQRMRCLRKTKLIIQCTKMS